MQARAQELGIRPQASLETEEEQEWDRVIPAKRFNFYTDEYREASARVRQFLPQGIQLPRLASTEIPWFVNGERSVTEIWRLVRAEYGNVTTANDDWKYAYVVTPETQDVGLEDVVAYVQAMEEAGLVESRRTLRAGKIGRHEPGDLPRVRQAFPGPGAVKRLSIGFHLSGDVRCKRPFHPRIRALEGFQVRPYGLLRGRNAAGS